jgi:hypothetical protein
MRSFNITHYIVHYFHFLLFSLSLLHDLLDGYKIEKTVRCTVGEDIIVELQLGICIRNSTIISSPTVHLTIFIYFIPIQQIVQK